MKEELVRLARAEALNPIQLRLWSCCDPSANICRNQNHEKALDRNGMVVIQSVRNQESRYVGFLQGGVTHLYKEGSKGVGIT